MAGRTDAENPLEYKQKPEFQTLAINIPGIVYRVYVREQNRMEFFNSMLKQMTGYKADELRTGEVCSIDPIINPEDRIQILQAVKGALRENKPFEVEYRVTHKKGGIRYFLERGQPVYGNDRKPEYIDGVILDITDRKRSERALCESEERFRSVLENSIDVIYRLNLKTNHFDYVSPVSIEVTGFTPDELNAMGMDKVLHRVHHDDRTHMTKAMKHISKCGKGQLEYRFMVKNGEYRWLATTFLVVKDKEGHPLHLIGVVRDITVRKQNEEAVLESHTRFIQLAENIKEVFWIGSPDWMEILYVSPTYESIWGRPCKSLYEQPLSWLDAVVDEDRGRVLQDLHQKTSGDLSDPRFSEYRISRPDSSIRWIFARAFPVLNERGEIYRIAGIAEDITERKKLELELRSSREELEIRVKERTAELERSNRDLQDFSFIASHDLQEPLRKIQTFGNMLTERNYGYLDDTARDYLKRMQMAATRMQELLNSLLAYSRVTTKANPMEETHLKKVIEGALLNLEILIEEKNAYVEVGELPTVKADRVQMIQVFQNLIGNALKFSRDDRAPQVKIHSQVVGDENRVYEIHVEDNGIGFSERYLDMIFQPFQRLHGRSSDYDGMGMGLAICKKIVERHGGKITARSELGMGSTFIVTLTGER